MPGLYPFVSGVFAFPRAARAGGTRLVCPKPGGLRRAIAAVPVVRGGDRGGLRAAYTVRGMALSPDSNSRFMPGLYPREFPRFAWLGQDALHVLKTLGDGEVLAAGREYLRRRRWRYAPGSAHLAFVEIDRDRPANPEIGASGLRRKELAPAFLLVIPVLRPAPCHFLFRPLVQPEHLDSEVGGKREGSDAAFRVVGFHAWIMSCASRPIRLVARQAPAPNPAATASPSRVRQPPCRASYVASRRKGRSLFHSQW